MKKIILLIVPVIILAIFVAIFITQNNKEHENLTTLNPGLYEVTFALKSGSKEAVLKMRVRYNPDRTYQGKVFLNQLPIEKIKGRYKIKDGKLESFDKFIRFPRKDKSWTPWESEKASSVAIRNITKSSYQYYLKAKDDKEKARFAAIGLKEGWKTYKRIRD